MEHRYSNKIKMIRQASPDTGADTTTWLVRCHLSQEWKGLITMSSVLLRMSNMKTILYLNRTNMNNISQDIPN
jgi:hypothetical protein